MEGEKRKELIAKSKGSKETLKTAKRGESESGESKEKRRESGDRK